MTYFVHKFTPADYVDARARVKSHKLNKYSYLGSDGQLKGALGEIAFEILLAKQGIQFKFVNDLRYDYELYVNGNIITADVKTKDRNYALQPHYEGSIPDYNAAFQSYDYAIFASLLTGQNGPGPYTTIYIGGMADKELLAAKGFPLVKGQTYITGQNDLGPYTTIYNGGMADKEFSLVKGPKPFVCKISCQNIFFCHMMDPIAWLAVIGATCDGTVPPASGPIP